MKVELYDNIKLKTGQNASVVEILGNHEAYIVDVDLGDDYETITVYVYYLVVSFRISYSER